MASVESLGFEHKPPHGLSPTCGKGSIRVLDEVQNESVGNLELRAELKVCDSFSPSDVGATRQQEGKKVTSSHFLGQGY